MEEKFDVKKMVKIGLLLTVVLFCYIFLSSWSQNGFQMKALQQMPTSLLVVLIITDLVISAMLAFIFAGIITNTAKRELHFSMKSFGKGLLGGLAWWLIDVLAIGFGNNPRLTLMQNVFSWSSLLDLVVGTLVCFLLFSSKIKKAAETKKDK